MGRVQIRVVMVSVAVAALVLVAAILGSLTAAMTAVFLYAASRNVGGSNLPRRGRYHSMRGCRVFDRGVFSSASATSAFAAFVGITAYVYQETADTDESEVASPDVPLEQRPHFLPQQSYPAVGYPAAPPPPPPYGGYGAKAPAGTA
ncbi:hypothetical protein CFC21_015907 [Triticum aestivum]|uniref:Uncharacterized protein n=3 Tax=Triticum TaxID=4564 RepID=A0A9R1R493_TRITD|nr:hypothetical protein CFC21_015907 [Triticum aestivum]VAH27692.1 unnamed protein product [Triticum turgidum subsp. durum]